MVTKNDIKKTLEEIGVKHDDTVIVHSSLKSFGVVDGGADTVIDALLEYLNEGTLVFPTLRQKDVDNAYKDWDINNTPSDVGLISETFRKRPNALRSDQETHSVSAIGVNAKFITEGHKDGKPRIGPWGDYGFSHSSPWQKLYDLNGKVLMLGVSFRYNTTRHLPEHMIVDDILNAITDEEIKKEAEAKVLRFEDRAKQVRVGDNGKMWLGRDAEREEEFIHKMGLAKTAYCGESLFKIMDIKPFVDLMYKELIETPERWLNKYAVSWINSYKSK